MDMGNEVWMDGHPGKRIWMDGTMVDWADARVHVLTHTLHYGLGLFEGIRCYKTDRGPAIFRLPEHITRLFHGAHIIGLKIPYSEEQLVTAIKQTLYENELEECYIRPLVYLGYGKMGLNPLGIPVRVSIAVWPWGAYLGEEGLASGIRVRISSYTRHHPNIMMTKAKVVGNYANSQLAKVEAIQCGYDEALLLDPAGYVAEGSGENVFMARNGLLKTPPLMSILEGITRASVVELARVEGIPLTEEPLSRDELYIADELFFTGTAAEITPVREVDNRTIGTGKPGPLTKRLQRQFFEIVHGKDERFKEWLTYL
jgi:branched-chain amino acid aminotransferase